MTDYRTQNALDEQAAELWHEADLLAAGYDAIDELLSNDKPHSPMLLTILRYT